MVAQAGPQGGGEVAGGKAGPQAGGGGEVCRAADEDWPRAGGVTPGGVEQGGVDHPSRPAKRVCGVAASSAEVIASADGWHDQGVGGPAPAPAPAGGDLDGVDGCGGYSGAHEPGGGDDGDVLHDTVGAVFVSAEGATAAAVSSGGLALKADGRVGEAAVYGAGCWAADCLPAAQGLGLGLGLEPGQAAAGEGGSTSASIQW